ncbi:uncharacterized protein LOC134214426 [Armigeres subalbatus]|uniref:uncharacterized protein LOC134214426 n=1 Tax=Armigeres subalbatus TaxID=124917 RepID=UPI002ED6B4F9
MERYLRFYIKFHSYVIAIATILGSIFMSVVFYQSTDSQYPLEEFYDYRYMGSVGLVFGVVWIVAGISLFYGIYKEVKQCLYPFVVMYMLDMLQLVLRDVILIWQNKRWFHMVFINPIAVIMTLYITLHVMTTLVAVRKLIERDPVAQLGTNFVRLNTEANRRIRMQQTNDDQDALVDD